MFRGDIREKGNDHSAVIGFQHRHLIHGHILQWGGLYFCQQLIYLIFTERFAGVATTANDIQQHETRKNRKKVFHNLLRLVGSVSSSDVLVRDVHREKILVMISPTFFESNATSFRVRMKR